MYVQAVIFRGFKIRCSDIWARSQQNTNIQNAIPGVHVFKNHHTILEADPRNPSMPRPATGPAGFPQFDKRGPFFEIPILRILVEY